MRREVKRLRRVNVHELGTRPIAGTVRNLHDDVCDISCRRLLRCATAGDLAPEVADQRRDVEPEANAAMPKVLLNGADGGPATQEMPARARAFRAGARAAGREPKARETIITDCKFPLKTAR